MNRKQWNFENDQVRSDYKMHAKTLKVTENM